MNRGHDTEAAGASPGALDFAAVGNEWGEAWAQRLLRHIRAKKLPGKVQRVERSG